MLRSMSALQFEEWADFYSQEPWGEWRSDLRAGIVASTIANVHLKQGADPLTPQDFMPFMEKPPISEQEIERKIETFMAGCTKH